MKRFLFPLLIAFAAPSFAAGAPHSSQPAPAPAVEVEEEGAPLVMLEVKSDQTLLDGEPIRWPQLEQVLNHAGQDVRVVLRVDRELPYKRVIEVLDQLQEFGVGNVSLLTDGDPQ